MTLDDIRKRVLSEGMPWSEPTWTGAAWKWQWTRTKQYVIEGPQGNWPEDTYTLVDGIQILSRPLKCSLLLGPSLAVFDTYEAVPYLIARRPMECWAEKDQITLDWVMTAWRFALGVTDVAPPNLMGT